MNSKILIVEDDEFLLKMYQKKFSLMGYEVMTAHNGVEGMERMKTEKPNLVLMDLMMPKMDGFEMLERVKKDVALKSIPVVVLTNLASDDDKEKVMSLGAADYIVKSGTTPAEVVEMVQKHF